jgi:hypothetical protein
MKRSIASALVVFACVVLFGVVLYADPGTDPVTADSTYVQPPPGYEGIWPPPDGLITTTGADTTDSSATTVDPWIDPNQ